MPRKTKKQKLRARRTHIPLSPAKLEAERQALLKCNCWLDNDRVILTDPQFCNNPLHQAQYQHVDIPPSLQVKVTYITDPRHPRYKSHAYINEHTGEGNNKHTGEYVKVEWRDEFDCWVNTI